MKRSPIERDHVREWEEIAGWGEARLMRDLEYRYQLRGGSDEDRKQALEWVAKHFGKVRWR